MLTHREGVGNYLRAIGNFIFPNFIFGGYIFGDPLVLKIHRELGWYGMDFGFMAEAIYSGGISMVIFMHASYGLFVGFFLKLSAKNKLISILRPLHENHLKNAKYSDMQSP